MIGRWVYRGYAALFVLFGLSSMLLAHREVVLWYSLDPPPASLLNQYRFLRAVEVGFGGLLLHVEDAVFAGRAPRALVVGTFWAIPAVRAASMAFDGIPSAANVGLAVAEVALALAFTVWTRPSA